MMTNTAALGRIHPQDAWGEFFERRSADALKLDREFLDRSGRDAIADLYGGGLTARLTQPLMDDLELAEKGSPQQFFNSVQRTCVEVRRMLLGEPIAVIGETFLRKWQEER